VLLAVNLAGNGAFGIRGAFVGDRRATATGGLRRERQRSEALRIRDELDGSPADLHLTVHDKSKAECHRSIGISPAFWAGGR
jgi:hypothetical protein